MAPKEAKVPASFFSYKGSDLAEDVVTRKECMLVEEQNGETVLLQVRHKSPTHWSAKHSTPNRQHS